ncbi:MAG: VOC family protein [Bryobacterales bacterium]|nr:VOC family protein [Bryobacterales bacterium]
MIVGIEHTAIASPDPQKLAQWYVETLGFVINYNSGKTAFIKAPNGSMFEIITSEGARAPQTMKDPGFRHAALTVSDFEAAHEKIKAAGVKFLTEPADSKGVKTVFFEDPDGNILHLLKRETPLP